MPHPACISHIPTPAKVTTDNLVDISTPELYSLSDLSFIVRKHLGKFVIVRGEESAAFDMFENMVEGCVGYRDACLEGGSTADPGNISNAVCISRRGEIAITVKQVDE